MHIKTEEQYRAAVKKYLELCEYPEGTLESDESLLLSKAMSIYENSQLQCETEIEIPRKISQN
jgi:antitoxin component HigA of HigAB toxin-antitoxin module